MKKIFVIAMSGAQRLRKNNPVLGRKEDGLPRHVPKRSAPRNDVKAICGVEIINILLLVSTISACSAKPNVMPPWRQEMATQGPQGASVKFQEGWRDGCESGSATSATQLQRLYYGFKINEQLIEDDEYYNAWNKAFKYCHRYLYQYHRKSFSN